MVVMLGIVAALQGDAESAAVVAGPGGRSGCPRRRTSRAAAAPAPSPRRRRSRQRIGEAMHAQVEQAAGATPAAAAVRPRRPAETVPAAEVAEQLRHPAAPRAAVGEGRDRPRAGSPCAARTGRSAGTCGSSIRSSGRRWLGRSSRPAARSGRSRSSSSRCPPSSSRRA